MNRCALSGQQDHARRVFARIRAGRQRANGHYPFAYSRLRKVTFLNSQAHYPRKRAQRLGRDRSILARISRPHECDPGFAFNEIHRTMRRWKCRNLNVVRARSARFNFAGSTCARTRRGRAARPCVFGAHLQGNCLPTGKPDAARRGVRFARVFTRRRR